MISYCIMTEGNIALRHVMLNDVEVYFKCHDKEAAKNFYSVPISFEEAKNKFRKKLYNIN